MINYKDVKNGAREVYKKRWGKPSMDDLIYLEGLTILFYDNRLEEESLSDIVDNIITVFELEKN